MASVFAEEMFFPLFLLSSLYASLSEVIRSGVKKMGFS